MPPGAEPETTSLLRDLVRLPSVNPMGRALQGADLYEHRVSAYLEEFFHGFVATVPEPASVALLGIGLAGSLLIAGKRMRRSS